METPGTNNTGDAGPQLGVTSVLVGSLPATLMTDRAPARYTVEAVFSRRPEPAEVAQIGGADTSAFFAQRGYPETGLTVADRRLRIANTNLQELRDGLAALIAERLAEISTDVSSRRHAAAARSQQAADREQHRTTTVTDLAGSIAFVAPHRPVAAEGAHARPAENGERAQLTNWDSEGGHQR